MPGYLGLGPAMFSASRHLWKEEKDGYPSTTRKKPIPSGIPVSSEDKANKTHLSIRLLSFYRKVWGSCGSCKSSGSRFLADLAYDDIQRGKRQGRQLPILTPVIAVDTCKIDTEY